MTPKFAFSLSLAWGMGLFVAAFALANFGPAPALAALGVVVMLGSYVSYAGARLDAAAAARDLLVDRAPTY